MKELPQKFKERMKALLGKDFEKYERAVNGEPVRAFRVNTSKLSLSDFNKIDDISNGNIPYVPNGFYLNCDKIGSHPLHHAGAIYVQEPAAMAPAECVNIDPDWCVLDMCAAPGGKSTQIKNKLGDSSVLVSNEIISSRCKILTGNIERLGLLNCVTTCLDTKKLAALFPNTFDLIMVDAPCSGEGMFRKEQIAIDEWSEENVKMCAARQLEILENAAKCLKNGGQIIYATCTFSLEENEMVVDAFLKAHGEFELCEVTDRVKNSTCDGICFKGCRCENIHFARRFYPHVSRGEGQFMAVMRHRGEKPAGYKKQAKATDKVDKLVFAFLDDVLESYDKSYVRMYNQNPVYFTPDFEVPKGAAFSCGVTIGEIKKGYIQPHHQFFMALGTKFKRKIDLLPHSDDLKRYLHGEEISVDAPNGWTAVTVCGCTVGGGKVVSGKLKNHYPKGLRTK